MGQVGWIDRTSARSDRRMIVSFIAAVVVQLLLFSFLQAGLFGSAFSPAERERADLVVFDLKSPPPSSTPTPPPPERSDESGGDRARNDIRPPVDEPEPYVALAPPSEIVLSEPTLVRSAQLSAGGTGVVDFGMGNRQGEGQGGGTGDDKGAGKGKRETVDGAGEAEQPPARSALKVEWAPGMFMSRLTIFYPPEMLKAGISGVAIVECEVLRYDRVRDCRLVSETPAEKGFGEATLRAERVFRLRLFDDRGRRVYNQRARIRIKYDKDGYVG